MADWYVWSGATGSGTGANWTNAYTTLSAALTAKAAGDRFFISHDYVQNAAGANLSLTSAGTETLPCRIYCVDRTGSVPPNSGDLRETAQVNLTGAFSITLAGTVAECYGIKFSSGSSSNNGSITISGSASRTWRCVKCRFTLATTSTAARVALGSTAGMVILEDCIVKFGSVSQGIAPHCRAIIRGSDDSFVDATGSLPTSLFLPSTTSSNVLVEGVDLSAISAKTLYSMTGTGMPSITFKHCLLPASVSIQTGTNPSRGAGEIHLIGCGSGTQEGYRTERYAYSGTMITTTGVYRDGGATDGINNFSWAITTDANAEPEIPFECIPMTIWNEDIISGDIEVIVYGTWSGGGSPPTTSEIWMEVEYLQDDETNPLGNAINTKTAVLESVNSYSTDPSDDWVSGAGDDFLMSVVFGAPTTPGPITVTVKVGRVSSTFWIDPKPVMIAI